MGSVGGPRSPHSNLVRGEFAERIVADEMEEPIGDSGQPWEGDVIRTYEEIPTSELVIIDIDRLERRFDTLSRKSRFTSADIKNLHKLQEDIMGQIRIHRTQELMDLLDSVNDLLRE